MSSLDSPAGTAGRIARWALRNILAILLFTIAIAATALLHDVLAPYVHLLVVQCGRWLTPIVVIAFVIGFVLRKIL